MKQGDRTGRAELGPGWCFCPTPSHLPWGGDEQERCGFPYSFKAFFFGFTVAEASQPSARCLVGAGIPRPSGAGVMDGRRGRASAVRGVALAGGSVWSQASGMCRGP